MTKEKHILYIGTVALCFVVLATLFGWSDEVRDAEDVDWYTGPVLQGVARERGEAPRTRPVALNSRSICGRVLSAGKAVHGAFVNIQPLSVRDGRGSITGRLDAETDVDGSWEIGGIPIDVPLGVSVSAPGHLPIDVEVDSSATCDRAALMMELQRGGRRIHGVVRDALGGPVPHARISGLARSLSLPPVFKRAPYVAIADTEGKYELWAPEGDLTLDARAEGYSEERRDVVVHRDTLVDFSLLPGGRIEGRVIDPAETPVPGAAVYGSNANDYYDVVVGAAALAISGPDGRFSIEGLPPQDVYLFASAPGYLSFEGTPVSLGLAGHAPGVAVRVREAPSLKGRVLARGSEEPVAGALVTLRSKAGSWVSEPTKEDGTYHLDAILPNEYRVMLVEHSHVPQTTAGIISIPDAGVVEQDWFLDRGISLHGVVRGGSSSTKVSVSVDLESIKSPKEFAPALSNILPATQCDPDGRFELTKLLPGKITVVAEDPLEGRASRTLEITQDMENIELDLVASGGVSGQVVDSEGAPMQQVLVSFERVDQPTTMMVGPEASKTSVLTGMHGQFEITSLVEGVYAVVVSDGVRTVVLEGNAPETRVEVSRQEWVELSLVAAPHRGILWGEVVGVDGVHVEGALVRVVGPDQVAHSTVSDADGWFQVEGLPNGGEVDVFVSAPEASGLVHRRARIGSEIRVILPRLFDAVIALSGIGHGWITVTGSKYERRRIYADGSVRIVGLAQGEYAVSAAGDLGFADTKFSVRDRGVKVELSGEPWSTITGRAERADGTPLEDAVVVVNHEHGRARSTTDEAIVHGTGVTTTKDGRFTVTGAYPGKNSVMIAKLNGRERVVFSVEVPHGGNLDVGTVIAKADSRDDLQTAVNGAVEP